jgi:hypothetical protein
MATACLALSSASTVHAGGAIKTAGGAVGSMACAVGGVARPVADILGGLGLRLESSPLMTGKASTDSAKGLNFKAVVVDGSQLGGAEVGEEVTVTVTDPNTCAFSVARGSKDSAAVADGKQLRGGGAATLRGPRPMLGGAQPEALEFQVDTMGRAVRR